MKRNLEVTVGSGDSLDVRHFNVEAGMNRPFAVEVVAVADNMNIDFEAIVGAPASFTMAIEHVGVEAIGGAKPLDARRIYAGICVDARQLGAEEKGLSTYRLRIAPTLAILDHRSNSRIFQYKSELEIALQILKEWRIPVDVRVDLASHKRRKYKVQYEETDLSYINRMLEEAGVAYWFDTTPNAPGTLIIAENPERGERRVRPIRFFDQPNLESGIEYATALQFERRVAPGRYTVRDHDYRLAPSYKLAQTSESGLDIEKQLEIFDYVEGAMLFAGGETDEGKLADRKGKTRTDETEGQKLARRRLEALRAESVALWFDTNAFDIGVGAVITIGDHPRTEKTPLLVTATHVSGGFEGGWVLECEATTADRTYRPPLRTPRPVANGVESAVVVGPPGEEIHCDEFGRVKVHFHWDRESRMDDDSSCWIHVSQSWGGAGYGGSMLPRIGQEVLVEFLGGDPDRPVIVGRVYTALQTTPYALPANKTQGGIRSNSTGGGGHNELMMEDKAGNELLRMRAEKDRHTHVGNDCITGVRNNRTMGIGGNLKTKVGGNESRTVTGNSNLTVTGLYASKVTGPSSFTSASFQFTADKQHIGMKATTEWSNEAPKVKTVATNLYTVTCGASRIYITPSTIAMDAPTILINPGAGMMDYVAFNGGPPPPPEVPQPPDQTGGPPAEPQPYPEEQDPTGQRYARELKNYEETKDRRNAAWEKYEQDKKQYKDKVDAYTRRINQLSNSNRYRPPGYEKAEI